MAEGYLKVANLSDIQSGKMKAVKLGDDDVLLVNIDGNFHAIGNVCTHRGGPLADGNLEGKVVTCPWHGGQFDVTTAQAVSPPPVRPSQKYEVKLQGSEIYLKKL